MESTRDNDFDVLLGMDILLIVSIQVDGNGTFILSFWKSCCSGARSALEWVVDRYRKKTDKRSQIQNRLLSTQ